MSAVTRPVCLCTNSCMHAGVCGGCAYQGIPYERQIEIKNEAVVSLLDEYGVTPDEYRPFKPAGNIFGYRNKMEYSFGDEIKEGPMTLGLHKHGSYMSVVNTEDCLIVPDSFNTLRATVLGWAAESGHSFHHKRSHRGFLRSLVLRRGERTRELLVNLVTTSEEELDAATFCDAVLSAIRDNGEQNDVTLPSTHCKEEQVIRHDTKRSEADEIVGILHTINDRRSDVVACDSVRILFGRDHYFEKLLGLSFRIGTFSFFQTNTSAVEYMLGEALSLIPNEIVGDINEGAVATTDKNTATIYDIYCGTGAITLALSRKAAKITGLELSEDSVNAARENALRNEISNVDFICGDAFEVLKDLPPPKMVVLDPPRMGLHPKALKRIIEYDLSRILYISCNPKTFAENAAVLKKAGYRVLSLNAYDNFPFTKHIELAALIGRSITGL